MYTHNALLSTLYQAGIILGMILKLKLPTFLALIIKIGEPKPKLQKCIQKSPTYIPSTYLKKSVLFPPISVFKYQFKKVIIWKSEMTLFLENPKKDLSRFASLPDYLSWLDAHSYMI